MLTILFHHGWPCTDVSVPHVPSLHTTLDLLIFPLPDLFDEVLSAEVMSGHPSLPHQFLLHHHLSRNASVIAARVPQRGLASHPVPASSDEGGPIRHRSALGY